MQGTVMGQAEKLAEVESALAVLQVSSSEREQAARQLEADLKAELQEAQEMVIQALLDKSGRKMEMQACTVGHPA